MKIIPPISITDARLTSSNVAENDYTAWSALTAYVAGDRCIVTASGVHKIYECLINNTNYYPPDNVSGATPKWLEVSSTNRWKMFDSQIATSTVNATSIVVEITPGTVINSVALFGLVGYSVRFELTDPTAGLVYDETVLIVEYPNDDNWYDYLFGGYETIGEIVKTDLPPHGAATLKVTITATDGGNAECGHCVIGKVNELGVTVFGTSVGIIDYSTKEFDSFGNPVIVERAFANTVDFDVRVESLYGVYNAQRKLAALRATPCVFMGAPDIYPSTMVYGRYQDFSITISTPAYSTATIKVLGYT